MLVDSHCHVIATDTKRYPLKPLFGKQSDWSAEHPLDYPDMVKAAKAASVDKSILVQASSAYAFDNSYVADSVAAHPERFIGVLIEHFAGSFPLWLAPEQARVITVSEKSEEYGRQVEQKLKAAGLRVKGDYRPEKLGAKRANR